MKLLFFDIDGTLTDPKGQVPQSAIDALKQAQANGHKTCLCTGRSYNQIPKQLIDLEFDGIVAATGSYVSFEGRQLVLDTFGADRVAEVMNIFKGSKTGFLFQSPYYNFTSEKIFEPPMVQALQYQKKIKHLYELHNFPVVKYDEDIEHYPEHHPDVDAIIYCDSPYSVEELKGMMPEGLNVELASFKTPEPYSGEITLKNNSKGSGMEVICDALGMTKDDIISFGDGPNDLEMFQSSGYCVAMGNGVEPTKNAADYITDDVSNDGLAKAIKYLGLI